MAALVDTNVLVYRVDPRFPEKRQRATEILRQGIATDSIRLSHQAVVEFHAAVTRPLRRARPLLAAAEARRETEELLAQFVILFPNAETIRLALRGEATYQLSWFDALMWAMAEQNGLDALLSEDFENHRMYGSVRVIDPFA